MSIQARLLYFSAALILAGCTFLNSSEVLRAQSLQTQAPGLPEDWSHHRVVFSNPGTLADALRKGKLQEWNRLINDRRYQIASLKRNFRPGAERTKQLKTDWSMDLGPGATVGAGQYAAKFSFSSTQASCSDYAAFNTGVTGASGGQANIVGYANLYDSPTCPTPNPSVSWAYFSGTGSALTSPVISLDGTKIAYVENTGSGAILRVLKFISGQGTPSASVPPDEIYTNTTVGASGNTAWTLSKCPTVNSCLYSVAFHGGDQDKISAPFYVYDTDTLYAGDASGNLHQFTGVFSGTPAEVVTGGWPIAVSGHVLTSPVYDSGTSGNIFVADSGGYLYSYNASTAAHVMTSSKLTYASGTAGIVDAPIVDSTTEEVYVFVGDDANVTTTGNYNCESTTGCSGVFQFPAATSGTGTGACAATSATAWPSPSGSICGQEAVFGAGTTTTPNMYDGAFDHIYQVGTGTTGNLWVCAPKVSSESRLSYVIMQSDGGIVPSGDVIFFSTNVVTAISALTNGTSTCSSVTEIFNPGTGTGNAEDYIFLSVTANGNLTTTNAAARCAGACVYNFEIASGGTASTAGTLTSPATAYAGIAASGGSSGIIVDNTLTAASESQIYYTPLANMSCAGNGTTGSGTGGCAVQTSQTIP